MKDDGVRLLQGDCLELMRELEDESVDACITDPPAGIGFMNKDWDKDKGEITTGNYIVSEVDLFELARVNWLETF